ncbi:polysaccharide pyruvyl transferase family protein [Isoptericola sp. NPDC056578]|uniref:polysaccharide pyruvyl transferase family protein n=1 Tax=unclassified Isoptericola TaxID=2623355 RepID=UPI0036B00E57
MTSDTSTPRSVLLRSSWANANIGDVAHSPGLITALLDSEPGARITLWPMRLGEREEAMIRRAVPTVTIVRGDLDEAGVPTTPELATAWESADVLVHGSAASASLVPELASWREQSARPYGYAGVTVDPLFPRAWGSLERLRVMTQALPATFLEDDGRAIIDDAEFLFARDSISLEFLRAQGASPQVLEFGPDGTFAYRYRDDTAGDAVLGSLGLAAGEFGCFVPRLRYAPYPDIYGTERTREFDRLYAINAGTVGFDLDTLTAAITTWVRETGQPAVVVPEMSYAVELARDELLPRVPADVHDRVLVLDRYWTLEEASSVYARARAVVSMECHSPILASVHGTPTIYVRLPTETVKGGMYADLGGADVVVEVEPGGPEAAAAAVETLLSDEAAARATSSAINAAAVGRLTDMARTILFGEGASEYPPRTQEADLVPAR